MLSFNVLLKLRLRTKLIIGFGVMALLILFMGLIGHYGASTISDESTRLVSYNLPQIQLAHSLMENFNRLNNESHLFIQKWGENDIAKAENKLVMSSFWGSINEKRGIQKKISKLGLSKFSQDFYIYSLEWSQNKLVWKINDVEVASSTNGVPQESMYLILSSGIYKDIQGNNLPAAMEIDWVRCYKRV